jgi:hypothetical protein
MIGYKYKIQFVLFLMLVDYLMTWLFMILIIMIISGLNGQKTDH